MLQREIGLSGLLSLRPGLLVSAGIAQPPLHHFGASEADPHGLVDCILFLHSMIEYEMRD